MAGDGTNSQLRVSKNIILDEVEVRRKRDTHLMIPMYVKFLLKINDTDV